MKKTFIKFAANRAPKIQSRRFGLQSFVNVAYKTDGKEGDDPDIKAEYLKELNVMRESLEKKAKEDAKAEVAEQLETVNQAIKELKEAQPEVTAEEIKEIKSSVDVALKALNMLNIAVKGQRNTPAAKSEVKTFNEILGETIERNINEIKSHKKGSGGLSFDMLPEVKAKSSDDKREVKAVGDMSIAANFATATTNNYLTERRPMTDLIQSPYNRVWLSDILPGGNSTAPSVLYPKENGGEGGAALWEDPTQDKPEMDFDLTSTQAFFKWIAGIVIIDREMLDDIPFMLSYIQSKMLISLKTAENAFILNGSTGTNPVTGLLTAATAYSGDYTAAVDKIVDAAWGQIVEDTNEFYNPTTVVMMPRAAVQIGLNKATGSGEYDLPAGTVAFSQANLALAGLENVRTTAIGANNFLAMDKNATMYIRRMAPELRLFEDATLAKKNKLMFRVEGRSTLAIFNNSAIVKGTIA